MDINFDELAEKLKNKFGESLINDDSNEDDPYDWWLMDVSVIDIIEFFKEELNPIINDNKRTLREAQVLTGEDAVRFHEAMLNPKPISQEERERMKKAYDLVESISNKEICLACNNKVKMTIQKHCPNCNTTQ